MSNAANQMPPGLDTLGWTRDSEPKDRVRDVLTAYNGLRAFESDFDKAQAQLRTIASTWLLAGIGALGFIVNGELGHAPASGTTPATGFDPQTAALLRQTLLLVLSLGLTSIWRLDQKVYQSLLHNVFALGYWIEYKYAFVPPTRLMLYHGNNDITDSLGDFYSRPVGIIAFCAFLNMAYAAYWYLNASPAMPSAAMLFFTALLFLGHLAYVLITWRASQGWGRLGTLLPAAGQAAKQQRFGPPDRDPFAL